MPLRGEGGGNGGSGRTGAVLFPVGESGLRAEFEPNNHFRLPPADGTAMDTDRGRKCALGHHLVNG
jgi:hypothetical protein